MRLKTLFFPFMLVLALFIFYFYVWKQQISSDGDFWKMKSDYNNLAAELVSEQQRQVTINETKGKLDANKETENLIRNYLPEKTYEERIINSISEVATGSEVSLINVSVKNPEELETAAVDPGASQAAGQKDFPAGIKKTRVVISATGDYDRLKLFAGKIQRMNLFNQLVSFSVVSEEKMSVSTTGSAQKSTAISATFSFDFLFLPKIQKASIEQLKNFKANIDNETVDALKEYARSTVPGFGSTSSGKINPFIP